MPDGNGLRDRAAVRNAHVFSRRAQLRPSASSGAVDRADRLLDTVLTAVSHDSPVHPPPDPRRVRELFLNTPCAPGAGRDGEWRSVPCGSTTGVWKLRREIRDVLYRWSRTAHQSFHLGVEHSPPQTAPRNRARNSRRRINGIAPAAARRRAASSARAAFRRGCTGAAARQGRNGHMPKIAAECDGRNSRPRHRSDADGLKKCRALGRRCCYERCPERAGSTTGAGYWGV